MAGGLVEIIAQYVRHDQFELNATICSAFVTKGETISDQSDQNRGN